MKSSTRYPLWLGLQFIGLPVLLFLVFGGSLAQLSGAMQQLVGIAAVIALALIVCGLMLARQLQRRQLQLIAAQEEFIAHASHELKTPITAQRTLLEVSRNDTPPVSTKEWRSFIDRVLTQNSRLERLSMQLIQLNLDRADDAYEIIDVKATVEQAINSVRALADSKLIAIHSDTASLQVKVRPDDLHDILVIVLDNAIKFSPRSSTITVTSGTQNGHAIISIRDQGIGMSNKDISQAFEPFYRGRATKTNGSGLGLAIARKLAKRNGSTIMLARNADHGLSVVISLPV